ncbi:MAG: PhnD/SsuA/transferrin family substrate-binding protein [Deltaproteobacteria bacterium]|nr:PhnD/SsuA/transferrin family substrate-binding protein [Deltaproteobacteria bacterium]
MASPGPVPKRLGRYDIMERLATGGMAEIFLACERGLRGMERLVVIKKILPHLAVQQNFVDMFAQEARIAARLSHPNVVQIHDLVEDGDDIIIVMEYVPGSTLRELTEAAEELGRPIPPGAAVGMVVQACRGAHAAHELRDGVNRPLGLVHRDISPHNLMVTSDGNVKLLDFGIAKATEGLENTATGTLKGKYCYMSPEQCNHLALDRRSDVFALGIVLWELLAGTRLYKRESELASMQAIVNEDAPRITTLRPDVPAAVADVLARALVRDREHRTPSADEFRRGLVEAAEQSGLSANEDVVAAHVRDTLGAQHEDRRAQVEKVVERTLAQTPSVSSPGRLRRAAVVPPAEDTHDAVTAVERKVPVPPEPAPPVAPVHASSRWRRAVVSVLAALGGAVVAWTGLMYFTGGFRSDPPLKGPPVYVGFPPVMDAALQTRELEPLRTYLERTLLRPVRFPVNRSYDETAAHVLNGTYAFGSLPPYLYLKTHAKDARVLPLVFKAFEGSSSGTEGVLLVTDQVAAQTIKETAGLSFCFTDPSSLTGFIMPRAALKMAGLDPDVAAARRHFSGDHLQVLRDLLAGQCDVGATFSGAYLSAPQAGLQVGRLRMLAVTGRSPQDAICAGPAATEPERRALTEALVKFDPRVHAGGVNALGEVQRITGFSPGTDKAYESLRAQLALAGMLN